MVPLESVVSPSSVRMSHRSLDGTASGQQQLSHVSFRTDWSVREWHSCLRCKGVAQLSQVTAFSFFLSAEKEEFADLLLDES